LREDIARALVVASGWDGNSTLLDPCCGSGTILIEATMWAQGIPPGLHRSFAFGSTPLGNHVSLEQVRQTRLSQTRPADFRLIGADCDAHALVAAQENWQAAFADAAPSESNFSPTITWIQQDIRRLELPHEPCAIVTNPPWGDRIRPAQHLASVYQRLGDLRRANGGRLALITSQRELAYKTGVRLHSAFLTDAGGIKANVFVE
jgi:putative N6-adenine-specific DNA methylase